MAETDLDRYWYEVKFSLKMLSDADEYVAIHHPDSPLHPLIANEILRPIIESMEGDVTLWRFSRMSEPQEKTHQFAFNFYGPQTLCSEVLRNVYADETYKEMKESDYLELGGNEDIAVIRLGPDIKDISDQGWPDEVREAWPFFIQGVSQSWLKMVEMSANMLRETLPCGTLEEKENFYNHVKRVMTERWMRFGWASMLNHLNAMFGHKYIDISLGMFSFRNINPTMIPVPTTQGNMMLPGINAQIRL